ncbi:heparanase-like protein 1 isoform X3 [Cannabis sativa]|uniref:heparanase-like protein 1 isoform X3 n=1 Tax=Cannabis sativa TaxID=3483 RepID=UPI0029CA5DF6|nr:heparanase-like protein 1 isoform X3 [Cannabis sativa]
MKIVMKVMLFNFVVLFLPISSSEFVRVTIRGESSIGKTDDNFICATLDWWPPEKCDYNQCPWGNAGILNLDIKNKIFVNAITAFNPLRIRLGGSLEDLVVYDVGNAVKECPKFRLQKNGLFGFSNGCLSQTRWDELNYLFNQTRALVTFSLNALYGKIASREDKLWIGEWNPENARQLMEYTLEKGYKIDSYELGVDPGVINRIQDPVYLDKVAHTYRNVSRIVKKYSPKAGAWVGEAGGAYNSGGKNVQDRFVDGFWYLDQLGMASSLDHKVYCRQALIGGFYGLLNTTTFVPNPDYYGALLWHRLMGKEVLAASHDGSPKLRAYSHCSKNKPGITLLLINFSNSTFFHVVISVYPFQKLSERRSQREEYHLTAKNGYIQSDEVLLNGTPLQLTNSSDIPLMEPILVDSYSPVCVAPDSFVFVVFKDKRAFACV